MRLVSPGMRVVDVAGEPVGTVTDVTVGDPFAVAAQEPVSGAGVLGDQVPHTQEGDEPDVPADLAARLLRTGYLRVAPATPTTGVRYAGADQIAGVTDGQVTLAVTAAHLVPEAEPR